MIKLSDAPSLSQRPCVWDTRLVSDVSGQPDESRKQGRREKGEIDLFHACFQPLDESKMKGYDQIKLISACALSTVRSGQDGARSKGQEWRRLISISLSLLSAHTTALELEGKLLSCVSSLIKLPWLKLCHLD